MNLACALSGNAGLAGLRWLLLGSESRDVQRRELSTMLSPLHVLGACHLRHARFRLRPDVKLSAYFDVDIHPDGAGGRASRAVAIMWKPSWIGKGSPENPEVIQMEGQAMHSGVGAPFRRLTARVPEWGMRIQVSPLDASFPQLLRASDPGYLGDALAKAGPFVTHLSPQSAARCYNVTSVRYQPGQRHVLRYDPVDGNRRPAVFAKLYRSGESSRISEVTRLAGERLAEELKQITCLQPLACVPEDDVVLYPLISGAPLNELLRRPSQEIGGLLELAGQAIRALHSAPQVFSGLLRSHNFEAEMEEVVEKSHYLSSLLPSAGSEADSILARARQLYARLPEEPPTFTHGDLKAEHFWASAGELTLMDFDVSRLADPAIDIGQFLADLRLCYDVWGRNGVEQAQDRFLAGYAPEGPGERLVRARLYEALELIRAAGRRVPLFEDDWAVRTARLVRRAVTLLGDFEGGDGTAPGPICRAHQPPVTSGPQSAH